MQTIQLRGKGDEGKIYRHSVQYQLILYLVSFRFGWFRFVSGWFRFVSFRLVPFRFDRFRFVSIGFVSFRSVPFRFDRFRFVSFWFRFALYRDPSQQGRKKIIRLV